MFSGYYNWNIMAVIDASRYDPNSLVVTNSNFLVVKDGLGTFLYG